jgi:hypothetical protein
MAEDLRRCTALTLPFGEHGTRGSHGRSLHFANRAIRQLFVGDTYITDPTSDFVNEILFVPQANKDLNNRRLFQFIQPRQDISSISFAPTCDPRRTSFASAARAYFEIERQSLFEIDLESFGMNVSAWIAGRGSVTMEGSRSHIAFRLRFQKARNIESALTETLTLCAFLSLIAHQYIYPTNFSVGIAEGEHFDLHCRTVHHAVSREHTWVGYTLIRPDDAPERFCEVLRRWYATNKELLRSRYLYRYSLEKPYTYSGERFLALVQALEGLMRVPRHPFLDKHEMEIAEAALKAALPSCKKLAALIGKLRSNNTASPKRVLKLELPKIFSAASVGVRFSIDDFVDRVYLRRNKLSHGGPHLDHFLDGLVEDTQLLTAIVLMVECSLLGLEVSDALKKFQGVSLIPMPLVLP